MPVGATTVRRFAGNSGKKQERARGREKGEGNGSWRGPASGEAPLVLVSQGYRIARMMASDRSIDRSIGRAIKAPAQARIREGRRCNERGACCRTINTTRIERDEFQGQPRLQRGTRCRPQTRKNEEPMEEWGRCREREREREREAGWRGRRLG